MTGSPLLTIADELVKSLDRLRFGPPVSHVYSPLTYARAPYELYLRRYGAAPKEVVLLGMNPGPFGMAQTGVPFGEVESVRNWLKIEAPVGKPARENPKRPVAGFACPRSEVSGQRLWGWAKSRFETPERLFRRYFIANYCPLLFLEESGRNVTPDKLAKKERRPLIAHCDEALRATIAHLAPRFVLGVGRFAEQRAREALVGFNLTIGCIPHPSPASPGANRDWEKQVDRALAEYGI
jgi:single-strand selective monofunctional uracil DNA glycosylase